MFLIILDCLEHPGIGFQGFKNDTEKKPYCVGIFSSAYILPITFTCVEAKIPRLFTAWRSALCFVKSDLEPLSTYHS